MTVLLFKKKKKLIEWRTTSPIISFSTLTTYFYFTKKNRLIHFYKFELKKIFKDKKAVKS